MRAGELARSAHGWHSVPIRLANGLEYCAIPVAVFIFEPVWSMSRIVVIRVGNGVVSTDVMKAIVAHMPQSELFWTNARASGTLLGSQFAGAGQCRTRGKVERLCLSMVSTLAEPGPMPKPERCRGKRQRTRLRHPCGWKSWRRPVRIFQRNAKAIGSSSNGRTSFAALYHLCVEVEDCHVCCCSCCSFCFALRPQMRIAKRCISALCWCSLRSAQ
jgi:hypothetical protein